jgi:polyisoprenoid-binding protein YceI
MKNPLTSLFAPALSAVALALTLPLAAQNVRYNSVPNECKVRMDGTSTIHDWFAESGVIGGSVEADASFPDASKGAVKPKVEVNIPVRQLKSSGGRKMDSVMLEHMKGADHKMIKYSVLELVPKGANAAGGVDYDAKGTLTISGVTRTNNMPVTISKTGDKLKVSGATALKMTDYGIQPPAPDIGLGLIKTGDDVKLKFDWVTEKAQ